MCSVLNIKYVIKAGKWNKTYQKNGRVMNVSISGHFLFQLSSLTKLIVETKLKKQLSKLLGTHWEII